MESSLTALLWPLTVLLLAMPKAGVSDGAALRLHPREFLNDTNSYVCPPAVSGRVRRRYDDSYTKHPGAISYGTYDVRIFSSHGYASFDLAALPDSIEVLSARMCYYQYKHGSFGIYPPLTDLTVIPDVNAPAKRLFNDIGNGLVVDTLQYTPDGWVVRPFDSIGLAAVDSCRMRGQSINLGVRGGKCIDADAYGAGPYHPLRAYLEVQYSTNMSYSDVVAVWAGPGSFPLTADDSVVVAGRFTNTGNLSAYDIPTYLYCNGPVGDKTVIPALAPGETTSVRVALPPAGEPRIESLMVCSDAQGDWCRHNDTALGSTFVFPHGTRSAEAFEPEYCPLFPPPGWVVKGSGVWQRTGPVYLSAHSGEHHVAGSGYNSRLITYGLSPNSSTADTVGLFFSTPDSWCEAQVWALGSQDPSDTLDRLLNTTIQTGSWHEFHIGLNQFDGQTVYIGFRSSVFTGSPLLLDDVWFTSERAPGVEEQASLQMPSLLIAPSPARRGRVQLSYQLTEPGSVDVTVSDILGRIVYNERVTANAGGGAAQLDCRHLAAGVYFVSLRSTTITARRKFVIH